ncbi:MAG TPA: hypothetical protein VHS59_09725, partial [Bacillota bacterium]|nr:hypothetical protein [Bacillota bacterium]
MNYHKYIWTLLITIILSFIALPLMAAEKPAVQGKNASQAKPDQQPPVYLKNIIVIAIDDWPEKYVNDGTMPRVSGLGQEGIRGKVLDIAPLKGEKNNLDILFGSLPDLYKESQRLSMLIDSDDNKNTVNNKYNYIFALDAAERTNPEKIFKTVTENFSKLNPYFTLVNMASPQGSEADKTKFFRQVDSGIGRLMASLQEKGNYHNTMLVILGKTSVHSSTPGTSALKDDPPLYPLILRGPNLLN